MCIRDRGSVILALTPAKEGFHYVLASRTEDMRLLSKTLNGKLSGRGGGSPQMVQGSFAAGESMSRETFSACTDGETLSLIHIYCQLQAARLGILQTALLG